MNTDTRVLLDALVAPTGDDFHAFKEAMMRDGTCRPPSLPVNPDGIPAAMKAVERWCVWEYRFVQKKWTKVPVIATAYGRNRPGAKSNDARTWRSFEVALKRYQHPQGGCDGIGYFVDDGDAGLDLDGCRNPADGQVLEWGPRIIEAAECYAERSPTDTGYRIFGRGAAPPDFKKMFGGKVEAYSSKRMFTVTGQAVTDGLPPGDLQPVFDRLAVLEREVRAARANFYNPLGDAKAGSGQQSSSGSGQPADGEELADHQVIRRLLRKAKSAKLWDGDTSAYGDDDSRADAGLAMYLAFYCRKDIDQMDRLFRQSKLYTNEGRATKWNSKRGETTYGRQTLTRACELQASVYTGRRAGEPTVTVGGGREVEPNAEPPTDAPPTDAPPGDRPPDGSDAKPAETSSAGPVYRRLTNYRLVPNEDDPDKVDHCPLAAETILANLFAATGGWPKRVEQRLFADRGDGKPLWLEDVNALYAFARSVLERNGVDQAVQWVDRLVGGVTKGEFLSHVCMAAEPFDLIAEVPHFPPVRCVYYMERPFGSRGAGGDGKALERLVNFFNPATPIDRDLIRAMFLTVVWGGKPGGRPAFNITPDPADPKRGIGLGKSTLGKMVARLTGEPLQFDQDKPCPVSELKTRFLTNARNKRVVLVDNLRGKSAEYWPQIEEIVTASVISGKANYVGEGSTANLLTWIVTNNGATFSKDTASRMVTVRLVRPEEVPGWETAVEQHIDHNRWAILDDMAAVFARPPVPFTRAGRWADWAAEVLARSSADPNACVAELEARQGQVDESGDEEHRLRDALRSAARQAGLDSDTVSILFRAPAVRRLVFDATGERQTSKSATTYLKELKLPDFKKGDQDGQRLWRWHAPYGDDSAPPVVDYHDGGGKGPSGYVSEGRRRFTTGAA